ncbi:hypothetical protein C5B42_02000 [Candidatus Cerribacteria bacterium 'Amazon FNV 2010 28 9']|uniref:Carbohydrate kinase PfkB domain-containing protein n=1 Tax=Candidatus Cerribacteria bacterium 'Amazon FNV 2010 28 9' TaxID=2081795 RepID=A0A317JPI8_9BACT|nr:MAG: hypothetical protein C5B42_02000 [Candidatus Cerribacteria bacterium 'Amazon FNV 2010 28 9']
MSFDVVSIGSGVLDVLLRSSQFTITPVHEELMLCEMYGGKQNVEDAVLASGGAGTNTAVSFARQGLKTACIVELGIDVPAQIIVDDLIKEKVDRSLLVHREGERTGISAVLVANDGSRTALTFRGAAHHLTKENIPFDTLKGVKAIHLSSIGNTQVILAIMQFCKLNTIFLSWNPSKMEAEDVFLRAPNKQELFTDVLFVNDSEWKGIASQETLVRQVAKTIVITKGKDGGQTLSTSGDSSYQAEKLENVVDETGAGDAFAAGYTGSILRGKSHEEALSFAIDNATGVVMQMGAKAGLLQL